MEYHYTITPDDGVRALTEDISEKLKSGASVLWLVCGGSNIPLSVQVLSNLLATCGVDELTRLTVMQTDERYGDVSHPHSNWQELIQSGFQVERIRSIPILASLPLAETTERYEEQLAVAYEHAEYIVGQFGIGADGHIAGILPHSPAVNERKMLMVGYEATPFIRVTITPPAFRQIHTAYAFVFGESKRVAVENLCTQMLTIQEEPAGLLKEVSRAVLFGDCVPRV